MMFEIRIDIFDNSNIIWSLYCEHVPISKHRVFLAFLVRFFLIMI